MQRGKNRKYTAAFTKAFRHTMSEGLNNNVNALSVSLWTLVK